MTNAGIPNIHVSRIGIAESINMVYHRCEST